MKLLSLLVLSMLLVSCGKSGSSKTKERTKSMSQLNDKLKTMGLYVIHSPITTAVGDHVVVACDDASTTDKSTDNYARATALEEYKNSFGDMQEVRFGDGTRADIWKVEWAISSAVTKLESKLYEKTCPAEVLGAQKI